MYPRPLLTLTLLSLACLAASEPGPDMGLVGYWKLDGDGTDSSVFANDAVSTSGDPTPTANRDAEANSAVAFDGNDGYVISTSGPPASFASLTDEATIMAWVRVQASQPNDHSCIFTNEVGINRGLGVFYDQRVNPDGMTGIPAHHVHVSFGSGSTHHWTNTQSAIPVGSWVHITAAIKRGEPVRVYFDAVSQPLTTGVAWTSGDIDLTGVTTAIARAADATRRLNGDIDEVRVYNRKLEQDEIDWVYNSAPRHPDRCGSYDSISTRYFYDDGTGCESTPTIADACYYSAGDLVTTTPSTLRDDLSELKADGGTDYIYLSFDLADKYYDHQLQFADAPRGECAFWELVSATRDITDLDACFTTFVYRLPWADAYASDSSKCGWERDASGANVKLVLDFGVRAIEDLSSDRAGDTLTREVSFSHPVEVSFPTQVLASPVNVTVFAPVRALAVITGQSVTIDEASNTATMTLDLFTEVQAPFELHGITESTDALPDGITLVSEMAGGNDDATLRQNAECTDGTAVCGNTWRWQYSASSLSGTPASDHPCNFDGTYQVSFSVDCSQGTGHPSDDPDTDCPVDSSTDSVEITLTVSTSNHCPSVIDSVDLTAWLHVYDLPARTTAADDFVGDGTQDDGQTADLNDWQVAYFSTPVTSSQVAISRVELNQVWIIRHQETVTTADDDIIVLLDADNTINVAPYNTVGEIDCTVVAGVSNADATPTAVSAATGCSPTNPAGGTFSFNFKHGEGGNAAAGANSTAIFEFDVRTDSAGFAMVDDAIEEMQITAVLDVEYANAAKRVAGAAQSETRSREAEVSASFNTAGPGSSTASGSSALLGMNAMVVYGAAAVLAVVVLAAAVVLLRRRPSTPPMEKMQSTTELASTAV